MGRVPGSTGRAPAHLSVLPGGIGASAGLDDLEDERTTIEPAPDEAPTPIAASSSIEEQWEDGTTVAEQSTSGKRSAVVEESTIEDAARPLPPLALVPSPQPPDPAAAAKLVVIAGPDQGRVFDLRSGLEVRIGRAVDNDVVLTDIAVSRKHLALGWDGGAWVVHDNGSGNGTLINDRLEDGRCQLHHADRIEIGNTVLRFDHLPSAHQPALAGWGQKEEEAATVAGKAPVRPSQVAAATTAEPPRHRPASVTAPVRDRTPGPTRKRASGTEPPPPPGRARPATVPPPVPRVTTAAAVAPPPAAGSQPPTRPNVAAIPAPLTAAPSAPVAAPMSGPYTTPNPGPSMPGFSPFAGGVRPMTTTAQVEPRAYQTINPWTVSPPPRRRRMLWIGAGVAALVAAATAGALLSGGEPTPGASAANPPPDSAVATGAGSGSGAVDVAPGPIPAPTPNPAVVAPTPDPAVVAPPTPTPPTPTPPTPTPPTPAPTPTPPTPAVVKPEVARPAPTPPRPPDRPVVPKQPDRPRITSPGRNLDIDTPPPKPPVAATPKALTAAAKKAEGLYKAKDWKGAATTLRDAIGASTDPDAKALKTRAADYDAIGTNLNAALAFGTSRAPEALAAYKKAMAADRRAGGTHQGLLRDKIADVAPRAAASYMAKQNYEMAKAAADDAVNVGAGGTPMIEGVRTSLDRRAGEFYATALKLQKSKPEDSKSLARRITKMVPSSSPWYAKAVKLLSASAGGGDEDE